MSFSMGHGCNTGKKSSLTEAAFTAIMPEEVILS